MTDVETLVSEVLPYVKDAVSVYGKAVLSKAQDETASGTVQQGKRLLDTILKRGKTKKVEGAVKKLARDPEDSGATRELHDRIRDVLRADPDLARDLSAMLNVRVSRLTVTGDGNVIVGGDHQGPIHLGNTTNTVHHAEYDKGDGRNT